MTRFYILIYRSLALLPLRYSRALGRMVARIFYLTLKKRRRIAERNIQACFPDLSRQESEKLLRKHYQHLGQALADISFASWGSKRKFRRCMGIQGLDAVLETYQSGRSVILLSPHLVDALVAAIYLSQYLPLTAMYKAPRNAIVHRIYRLICKQPVDGEHWSDAWLGSKSGHQPLRLIEHRGGLRTVLKVLQNHGILFYLPDQDLGKRHAVFAPFFGQVAATVTAVSRFATLGNADLVLCSMYQTGNSGFRLQLKPLPDFPLQDEQSVARRINEETELAIAQDPAQYFWVHQRFKTRPPGEPSFYDKL